MRKVDIDAAHADWLTFYVGERVAGLVTVRQGLGFYPKDAEERAIPLRKRLREALEGYGVGPGSGCYLVEPEKFLRGKNRYRYEWRKEFVEVAAAAGLAELTPHVLRHTFASHLAQRGVSLYKVARWLGHADVRTTQIYAHLAPGDEDIELG